MPLIGSYVDTFSGTLDAGWTVAGAAITGGALAVNCSQNAGAAVYSSARRAGYTFANSQVLWELVAVPATVGNQANAQMWLLDPTPAATVDRLGFEYRAAAGELDMLGQTGATYSPIGTTVTVTYDATAMRWLRLRHTGTTIVWETSPDGAAANWTVRRTLPQGQVPSWVLETDTVTLSFEAFRTTGTNDTLRIDNLNNPPAAVTQPTGTLQEPVTVVRRNLVPNPALANDATGWNVAYYGSGSGTVATSRFNVGSEMDRGWSFRGVATSATTAHLASPKAAITVTPGQLYSITLQYRFSIAPTSAWLVVAWYDTSGANFATSTVSVTSQVTSGASLRSSATRTAPAGAVAVAAAIRWDASGPITVDATAARIEEIEDPELPYGDGSTAGWAWSGTAGGSTSSLTYAIATTRRNLLTNPALAINTTGWVTLGASGAASRVAVSNMDRPFAIKFAQSAAGTTAIRTPLAPVDGNGSYQRVAISIQWMFDSVPDGSGQVTWLGYDQAGNFLVLTSSSTVLPNIVAGTPGRTTLVRSVPAGTFFVGAQVAAQTATTPVTFYATAARVEAVEDVSMPYRDGDSYGWAWDSTPGASTSSTGPDRLRRSPRALQAVTRSYTF